MSWYKLAKDSVDILTQQIQQADRAKFTNSPDFPLPIEESTEPGLENSLNPTRDNTIINPKLMNELKQPVRTKATGQGGDALLNKNKDLPIYSDNFVNTTDWNTN